MYTVISKAIEVTLLDGSTVASETYAIVKATDNARYTKFHRWGDDKLYDIDLAGELLDNLIEGEDDRIEMLENELNKIN